MTRAVGDDDSLLKSLQEVVGLFKDAQTSVFKLMSSVSTAAARPSLDVVPDYVYRTPFPNSSKNLSMPLCWPNTTLITQWHKQINTDHRRWSCRSDREAKLFEIVIIGRHDEYDWPALACSFDSAGCRR